MSPPAADLLRVACIQCSPVHGDWDSSAAHVDALIAKASLTAGSNLDVVLLPEMALTGYMFVDSAAVRPLAECIAPFEMGAAGVAGVQPSR